MQAEFEDGRMADVAMPVASLLITGGGGGGGGRFPQILDLLQGLKIGLLCGLVPV